jgi:hypothetical protein
VRSPDIEVLPVNTVVEVGVLSINCTVVAVRPVGIKPTTYGSSGVEDEEEDEAEV